MPYVRVKEKAVASPTSQRATAMKRIAPTISTRSTIKASRVAKAHRPEVRPSFWIQHRLQRGDGTYRLMSSLGAPYNEMWMAP